MCEHGKPFLQIYSYLFIYMFIFTQKKMIKNLNHIEAEY